VPRRFCAICGKATEELVSGICPDCYLSLYPLAKLKKSPSLTLCKICLAYLHKGRWHHLRERDLVSGLKNATIKLIKDSIKPNREAILKEINPHVSEEQVIKIINGKRVKIAVEIIGTPSVALNKLYKQVMLLELKANWSLCPPCRRVKSKVERAILQIRVLGRELRDYEKKNLMRLVSQEIERLYDSDKEAVILDSDTKVGIDLHFTSRRIAKLIATTIQRKFGGKILETQKITGRDRSGKVVTKSTIRVLLPPFKSGDMILYKGKPLLVREIRGSYFYAISIEDGSKERITISDAYSGKVKVIEPSDLERVSVISIEYPYVQVMNLRNYRVYEVRVSKVPNWIKEGVEACILKLGEKVYFVPLK